MKLIADFLQEESGITAAEYGIILGLMSIAVAIGIAAFYTELGGLFNRWSGWFQGSSPPS